MKTKILYKHLALILLQCLFVTLLLAQTRPAKQWDKDFGTSSEDGFKILQQTKDGGYILGGYTDAGISGDKTQGSRGDYDYWIVKTDSNGVKKWDKRFGGSDLDLLFALQQTSDGGFILGGSSLSGISGDKSEASRGGEDYWIVKIDSNEVKQWDKRFGGSAIDRFTCLQQTSDGGYILGGESDSPVSGDRTASSPYVDYWIVKINSSGIKQWDKSYSACASLELTSIQQTKDGGYILGGYNYSSGSLTICGDHTENGKGAQDYWIVKTDANGVKQWDKTFGGGNFDGGSSLSDDWCTSLQQTTDGGYIFAGYSYGDVGKDKSENSRGDADYWIIKTDANGVKIWDKTFGGNDHEELYAIKQTADGGYILGGWTSSGLSGDITQARRGSEDYWIVKTNANGIKQWDARFGSTGYSDLYALQQTKDNGYILGGVSFGDIGGDKTQASKGGDDYWIVKLAGSGGTCANATALTTTNITANSATLNWVASVNPAQWQIQYRKAIAGTPWTNIRPAGSARSLTISSLTANQKYNWHIRAKCGTTWTAYSALKSFKTLLALQSVSVENAAIERSSSLMLYPNPSRGEITVVHNSLSSGKLLLKVFDNTGRMVFNATNSAIRGNNTYHLNLSNLAAGIYYLDVDNSREQKRIKFIIQK